MSRQQRIALLIGALAIAVAAFVLLRPSDDDEPASQATNPGSTTADTTGGKTAETTTRGATPKPEITRIRIREGQPVDGEARIQVNKNETVRLAVTSDVADEVHVHGYDLSKDVGPGQPARFTFKADLEGGFEIELEESAVPIAQLEVRP